MLIPLAHARRQRLLRRLMARYRLSPEHVAILTNRSADSVKAWLVPVTWRMARRIPEHALRLLWLQLKQKKSA